MSTTGIEWLDRDLVRCPVHYALCQDEKGFRKELKKLGIKNKDRPSFLLSTHAQATVHFFQSGDGKECAIVCICDHKGHSANEMVGLLIHEAVHIWQRVRDIMGECNPSKEFEAYSIQAIAQNLISAYRQD